MALGDVLKNIGASVGVGAATIEVVLEMQPKALGRGSFSYGAHSYASGETVAGRVIIKGGNVVQHINEITVDATEHWTTTDSDGKTQHHYKHYDTTEISRNFDLAPGQAFEGPFQTTLPLPANLMHDWSIRAHLGIARAADTTNDAALEILPPLYAQGLDACLLAALPVTRRGIAFSSSGSLDLDYAPPPHLTSELDGVKLMFAPLPNPDNGSVSGSLEINPQEKSFGDRIKSLTHGDRIRHPLSFTRALLEAASPRVTADPSPQIVAHLRGLLSPYLGAGR